MPHLNAKERRLFGLAGGIDGASVVEAGDTNRVGRRANTAAATLSGI